MNVYLRWAWLCAATASVACGTQSDPEPKTEPIATQSEALPANCSQAGFTVTCTFTTGFNTFEVPKGVSALHAIAVGGMGGSVVEAEGGLGAVVTGDIVVTGGTTLFAVVGSNGSNGNGGYNGGGSVAASGGGGGGASDLRTGPDLASRVLVAAGGGGGGRGGFNQGPSSSFPSPHGGYGGQPGMDGGRGRSAEKTFDWTSTAGYGGGGATSGSGGGGGDGGELLCDLGAECDDPNPGCHGSDGALGALGAGGVHTSATDECTEGGGGGGGGRYGGGGGGGGDAKYGRGGAGGGGGGSNLVPAGGTAEIDATGIPLIVISYTAPLVVSPTSLEFGSQAIGSTSTAKTATLNVTGTAGVSVSAVTLGGPNPSEFAITSDTCSGATTAAGSTCAVQVTFAPTATGARAATLSFADDATGSPQTVTLSGNGTTLADVGVTISGPAAALTGSQNTYVIRVDNAGPSTALGVVMTAQVPNGSKFLGVSATRGSCTQPASGATSGTIRCSLGDLVSGAAALDTVALKITLAPKGGTIVLAAQAASATTPDPAAGNNVASFSTKVTKK